MNKKTTTTQVTTRVVEEQKPSLLGKVVKGTVAATVVAASIATGLG